MSEAENKRDAVRRLFLVIADVARTEGIVADGGDPAFRELCNSPALPAMSGEEMRQRVRELMKVATELPC